MDVNIALLKSASLFAGMSDAEIRHLVDCLGAPIRTYGKGAILWQAGDTVEHAGIVLTGLIDAVQYQTDGSMQLVTRHKPGAVFGDLLMGAQRPSPVTLQTPDGAQVLFLSLDAILSDCGQGCPCHIRLRRNLFAEGAKKFFHLRRRLQYLSEPRLRQRVLSFLQDCQRDAGQDYFTIPFTRSEMADFLGANRSALSRELSQLQREGFIEFYRNSFRLLHA